MLGSLKAQTTLLSTQGLVFRKYRCSQRPEPLPLSKHLRATFCFLTQSLCRKLSNQIEPSSLGHTSSLGHST